MCTNGPAIKGESVPAFWDKKRDTVPDKRSHGRIFCHQGTSFVSYMSGCHDRAESADREKRVSVLASVMV
jgi:hypothetical protein